MPQPDGPIATLVALALAVSLLTGCKRLTFVRPDVDRGRERIVTEPVVLRPTNRGHDQAFTLTQVAQSRLMSGDTRAAMDAASKAVKADPASAEAHSLLALSLDALGRDGESGPHHARAAELAPQRGVLLNNYGIWLCSNGQASASLGWFERASVAPGYETPDVALANAGACALRAGDRSRGERAARQAIAIAPGNPLALQTLARIAFDARRGLEARAFVERRLAAAPADAETLQLASQIEQSLGDTAAAERYVRRLRAEFPRDSDAAGEGGRR